MTTPSVPEVLGPPEPESIEQTGLAESTIEQLLLKIIYFRGDVYGADLSSAIGLKFSVIQDLIELLKLHHLVQVKRSIGMGGVGAQYALTEAGRARAREHLEANQYAGPAPVPIDQYIELVRQQRPREGWLTKENLARAFRGMVVTENTVSQIGPAVSSGNSLLLYGKPGDGKTFLIESLQALDTAPIFLPYALECLGNIIQVYDPIYHQPIPEEEPSVLSISVERSYDKRWCKCRRPFIVSGGELSLDMLDLRYNTTSKIYEAPYQLKANNGIYLIDDFGRQRATPAEVLNRWIVPMERRVDYLSFMTGGKITAPFEAFLVFSTNLNPADLGDEAFLRRIQYKVLLRGPAENEFLRIFENFCASRGIACPRDLISRFVDRHYRKTGKVFRRCHPRDVLSHALNLIHFEKLPVKITDEILDRAFNTCFLQEEEDAIPATTPAMLPMMTPNCSDYWGDQVAQITTAFGTLVFAASYRDRMTGRYHDAESARQFGESETARVLLKQHNNSFAEWLNLSVDQQSRDISRYLAATDGNAAKMSFESRELIHLLAPGAVSNEDMRRFSANLTTVLDSLAPKEPPAPVPAPMPVLATPRERIA